MKRLEIIYTNILDVDGYSYWADVFDYVPDAVCYEITRMLSGVNEIIPVCFPLGMMT